MPLLSQKAKKTRKGTREREKERGEGDSEEPKGKLTSSERVSVLSLSLSSLFERRGGEEELTRIGNRSSLPS